MHYWSGGTNGQGGPSIEVGSNRHDARMSGFFFVCKFSKRLTACLVTTKVFPTKRAQHPPSRELETCVKPFLITARTATACLTFTTLAESSSDAVILTAELLGDQPCSITVKAGAR